jgi:arylsulfatase A-like enzyme
MKRREFLALAGSAALPSLAARTAKPNIILILADDLGIGDLGCYGQKLIKTPNIDRMAAEGMRFTQAYAGSTVCAPSRCCLMTGKHTGHARIRGNARVDLLPEDVTIAEVLKNAGYTTGIFGKWGLGTAGNNGVPNRQGFDEWFGYLDQKHAHTSYPTQLWENETEVFLDGNFGPKRTQFSQELFTQRGLSFIERHKASPFFLYMAYTLPHANNELTRQSGNGMEVPSDEPYSKESWPQPDKNFAAMVHMLDKDVGALMDKVKALGIENDTVFIFSSDNGAHKEGGNDPEFFNSNGPFQGIKRALYDGGIRTPFLARWPQQIKPGSVSDQVIAFWDFLPSAAELAGTKPPSGLDGISFVNALHGKPISRREYLYWEFHERGFHQAVRLENWKGVRRGSRRNPVELYDVVKDQSESSNLAAVHPEVAERIRSIMTSARTDSEPFPIQDLN